MTVYQQVLGFVGTSGTVVTELYRIRYLLAYGRGNGCSAVVSPHPQSLERAPILWLESSYIG
jgi:hypothetical protein